MHMIRVHRIHFKTPMLKAPSGNPAAIETEKS